MQYTQRNIKTNMRANKERQRKLKQVKATMKKHEGNIRKTRHKSNCEKQTDFKEQ